MKRKLPFKIIFFSAILGLIVFPEAAAAAARNALQVCAMNVIPSLFPFFVLSKLLLSSGLPVRFPNRFAAKCFGVSGDCLSAFCISLLGGYPAGVAALTDLYRNGAITKQDAERSLCFCNNSGPAFFVSFIGGTVLHSAKLGFLLYLIHGYTAMLCGILFSARPASALQVRRIEAKRNAVKKALPDAIAESCTSLLQICGLIVFFSVMLAVAEEAGLFRLPERIPHLPIRDVKALLCGVFELSVGILRSADSRHAFLLCAAIMGWGGFCVHLQAKALWQTVGLQPNGYYLSKLLQSLLSALFAFACAFPSALSVSVIICVSLFCLLIPTILKKWGGNPAKHTI